MNGVSGWTSLDLVRSPYSRGEAGLARSGLIGTRTSAVPCHLPLAPPDNQGATCPANSVLITC